MRSKKIGWGMAVAMILAVVPSSVAADEGESDGSGKVQFTISGYLDGNLTEPADARERVSSGSDESYGVHLLEAQDGRTYALADVSLTESEYGQAPAMWAASSEFVDLSWTALPGVREYSIYREDRLIETVATTSYRDTSFRADDSPIDYRVEAVLPSADVEGRIWGFLVSVPSASSTDSASMLEDLAEYRGTLATYTSTGVQHQTFIPQAKIAAPGIGCEYGKGYKFGGDNRSFQPGGKSRTRVTASIDWTKSGSMTSSKKVGATTVYNSSGTLVATKTASSANMSVTKLGASTSTSIDLRYKVTAGNPFCLKAVPIDAVFTMTVTRSGSWSIISGNHKQMPNHELYIHNGAKWTTAYKASYASDYCLIEMACERANMSGRVGSY
ncbi:Protein of unknown function [Ruaniaceae bacterium KH17]|nr:Protein of unknown function [Ruaniaceae bacterium KH17]